MHIAPVRPVAYLYRHQSRKLDTLQHHDIDDRIKDREISGRSHTQANIGKTFEGSPHPEKSGDKTYPNHHIDILDMQHHQVARNQYRTDHHENHPRRKPAFQAEQNRKNHRHPDKGSISGHCHILLDASQCTRHLECRRKKDTAIELKYHCKEQR